MTYSLGRAEPSWSDMSEHVAHLVRRRDSCTPYNNIIEILASSAIRATGPFGAARHLSPEVLTVSFTETPLHNLRRLFERRVGTAEADWHGLGFSKDFVAQRGGGPVLYVYEGAPQYGAVNKLTERASHDADDPFRQVAPFIELVHRKNRFEWEREWRIIGDFAWEVDEPSFVIMPEQFHAAAWDFFREAEAENTGPRYLCPYIDATWERPKILSALRGKHTRFDRNPYNE